MFMQSRHSMVEVVVGVGIGQLMNSDYAYGIIILFLSLPHSLLHLLIDDFRINVLPPYLPILS